MYEGKRVKEVRVTGNLNKSNTKMIMANITPHIEMRTMMMMLGAYPPTHRPQCTAQYTAPLYVTVALRHWLVHQPLRHTKLWLVISYAPYVIHITSFVVRHLSCLRVNTRTLRHDFSNCGQATGINNTHCSKCF